MEREYNILKHELVPEYVILTEEEKKKLFEELKILPQQLPKILTADPVIKAIEAKEGDVIKIIRSSPTAGETVYYRIVTKK